ncbi:MAG: hypothetical protein NTW19_02015 [Planctomycetota bacterium]|nr:hypothetical protein [Planctomycetota bacterium]
MNHNRVVQILAVLSLIASLTAAGFVSPYVNRERMAHQRVIGEELARSMPPHMAVFTVGLSVFRGIAVDVLWYRANALKDEGKYFEANQLSQWITALQPKFVQVWIFHAWNMAYNISVATNTPDERWEWVNKGLILLREQGIVANPKSHALYSYLNWMFYHKVGMFSDDMNWYYKARMALEWQEVMGDVPDGQTTQEAIDTFAKIAESPDTLPELISQYPEVKPVLQRLSDNDFPQPDERFCREYGRIQMYVLNTGAQLMGYSLKHPLPGVSDKLCKIMDDAELAPGLARVIAYARNRVITDRYRMNPDRMLDLMKTYGPMDWRHAAAHACYWSSLGTAIAEDEAARRGETKPKKADDKKADGKTADAKPAGPEELSKTKTRDIELLNTYRGSIHAMQELMFRGKISFDPAVNPPRIDLMPDPRFFAAYEHAMELAYDYMATTDPKGVAGAKNAFEDGHLNFLTTAMQFSYFYGEMSQARDYYDKIARLYGKKYPGKYDRPMEDLIRDNMVNNLDTMYHTQQFIDSMFQQAFTRGLMNGRPQVYERFLGLAKMVHSHWNEGRDKLFFRAEIGRDRQLLLPFPELLQVSYITFMRSNGLNPVTRARVWVISPIELRLATYDKIRDLAVVAASQAGLDPDLAFPEPPGVKEYRLAHPIEMNKAFEQPTKGPAQMERK